jgi:hypothetical protein
MRVKLDIKDITCNDFERELEKDVNEENYKIIVQTDKEIF